MPNTMHVIYVYFYIMPQGKIPPDISGILGSSRLYHYYTWYNVKEFRGPISHTRSYTSPFALSLGSICGHYGEPYYILLIGYSRSVWVGDW